MAYVRPRPAVVLFLLLLPAVGVVLRFGPPEFTRTFSGLATVTVATAAGVCCLLRAAARRGRLRGTWTGVGLGALSYAFGEAAWLWAETRHGPHVPFPSLPDAGYLGLIPLVTAGLLMVPVARQSATNRVRGAIDGLMIATSLVMLSWTFVMSPLLAAGDGTRAARTVSLAYLAGDVVVVTAVFCMLSLLRRGGPDSGQLLLVGVAMVQIGVTDGAFRYLLLDDSTAAGASLGIGWIGGFALIALAARLPDRPAPVGNPAGTPDRQSFVILLPYIAVVAALLISILLHPDSGGGDAFAIWIRSLLILLIVARQLLTLVENRHLTRHLESRVAARSTELQASEQRFRALVRQSSDSVAVIDPDSTVRYQSASVERIFGYRAEALIGIRLVDVLSRGSAQRLTAAIESLAGGEHAATTVIEVTVPHRDGRLRQAEMTITNLLADPAVGGLVINTRDIQDAKELQQQLVHEAYHDALTGLASRALYRERLTAAVRTSGRGEDVAVLFLDLDGFKEVNDSLGHAAGDQLLVQVAARLLESVRDGDLVARFGGDEFAVLVESVAAPVDAETVARRVVAALGEPFVVGDRHLHVGVSVGIASAADAGDIQQLQRNADLAMYRAKAAGGSCAVTYHQGMHDELVDRLALEADLRGALNRDELALHYQPTVDLASGEITGFEALVRWYHPVRGMVSPLDFIGIAETTGLIVPLGRWVLAEACRQAVAWGAGSTRRLKMAVNVSVRQFEHTDLAATVAEVLAETGLPVDQLCLEMTESVLLTDTDENLTQLLRLKALGVCLAMDDFGTGYSSLAYLRRFPMDVLKIDRSFVDRLGGDADDVALVQTIVRLGRSLGMTTVAEGIEDAAQLAVLRAMKCDFGQGYYLSRPLPAAEAGRVLQSGLGVTVLA